MNVDLQALPRPSAVPLDSWLMCFPAFAFLLCAPSGRAAECAEPFARRGLDVAVIGELDDSGLLSISMGQQRATVLDLRVDAVTGLQH